VVRSPPAAALPRAREQGLLRALAEVLADGEARSFLDSEILGDASEDRDARQEARRHRRSQGRTAPVDARTLDLTAVCLGLGASLANEELARRGIDGAAEAPDPSVAWRSRRPAEGPDLSGLLATLGLPPVTQSQPMAAREVVFVLAAQVVVRHPAPRDRAAFGDPWARRALAGPLRPFFARDVASLAVPRGSLGAQLGLAPMPPTRRRSIELPDGSQHYLDFEELLGVRRVHARRPGLLGWLLGRATERLRCSAAGCGAPLPTWSPRCVACGRPVKGEPPLAPTS
jgi:hypothetical protein